MGSGVPDSVDAPGQTPAEPSPAGRRALANTARTVSIQMAGLLTTVFERVVLTGLLIRQWGVEGYSDWVTVSAVAGMIVILEFGFQQFLGNQLVKAFARGHHRAFRQLFAWALWAIGALSVILVVGVGAVVLLVDLQAALGLFSRDFVGVFVLLGVWNIIKVARGPLLQIYRGRGEFYNFLWADIRATLVATALAVPAVLAGGGPLAVAALYLVVTVLLSVALPWRDLRRRHPGILAAAERPAPRAVRRGAQALPAYGVFFTTNNVVQNAPVLIIAALGLSGPLLVAFVVQRTLVNLARTISFSIANAVGAELSALHHQGDTVLLHQGIRLLSRTNTVVMALVGVGLLGFGDVVVQLWTGEASLGSWTLLALLLVPAILAAPALGLQQTAVLADAVGVQALASAVQLAVGIGGGLALGWLYGTLGVAAGFALAEIIAVSVLAGRAGAKRLGISYIRLLGDAGLLFAMVGGWSGLVLVALQGVWQDTGTAAMIGKAAIWCVLTVPPGVWICVPRSQRAVLLGRLPWLRHRDVKS